MFETTNWYDVFSADNSTKANAVLVRLRQDNETIGKYDDCFVKNMILFNIQKKIDYLKDFTK